MWQKVCWDKHGGWRFIVSVPLNLSRNQIVPIRRNTIVNNVESNDSGLVPSPPSAHGWGQLIESVYDSPTSLTIAELMTERNYIKRPILRMFNGFFYRIFFISIPFRTVMCFLTIYIYEVGSYLSVYLAVTESVNNGKHLSVKYSNDSWLYYLRTNYCVGKLWQLFIVTTA